MSDQNQKHDTEKRLTEALDAVAQLVAALESAETWARPYCPEQLKHDMPEAIIAGRKALGTWVTRS